MEIFLDYLIQYGPVVLAVITEIGVVASLIAKVKSFFTTTEKTVAELKESSEYKELKNNMIILMNDNRRLKQQLSLVLEQLTRVKVKDDADDKEV